MKQVTSYQTQLSVMHSAFYNDFFVIIYAYVVVHYRKRKENFPCTITNPLFGIMGVTSVAISSVSWRQWAFITKSINVSVFLPQIELSNRFDLFCTRKLEAFYRGKNVIFDISEGSISLFQLYLRKVDLFALDSRDLTNDHIRSQTDGCNGVNQVL
jgi:hypothetical protein